MHTVTLGYKSEGKTQVFYLNLDENRKSEICSEDVWRLIIFLIYEKILYTLYKSLDNLNFFPIVVTIIFVGFFLKDGNKNIYIFILIFLILKFLCRIPPIFKRKILHIMYNMDAKLYFAFGKILYKLVLIMN